jgi:hypothetical protein
MPRHPPFARKAWLMRAVINGAPDTAGFLSQYGNSCAPRVTFASHSNGLRSDLSRGEAVTDWCTPLMLQHFLCVR